MAAIVPNSQLHCILGNKSLHIFQFTSTTVADGDTYTLVEPDVIDDYWYQSHHSDVVSQSVNIASGVATFQVSATAPGTLFVLGGSA